jgi:hypothetical protein
VKFFRCGQSIKLSSRRMFCIVHKNATRLLDLASPPIKLGESKNVSYRKLRLRGSRRYRYNFGIFWKNVTYIF